MKSKIILLLLLIVNITFTVSAFEKASNKYANEARSIVLIAHGFSSGDTSYTEDGVIIYLVNFMSDKWIISVVSDDGVILSGSFYISSAYKTNGDPDFFGKGTNNETGEEVEFSFISFDKGADVGFYLYTEDKKIKKPLTMPLNSFYVHQDAEETMILFNESLGNYDINSPSWKIGTPKQLKNLLKKNPYLRKL